MSYFSTALQRTLDDRPELTQLAFARLTNTDPGQLSRYLSAANRPDVGALERLCAPLEESTRAALIIAYLRDEIPPASAHLIALRSQIDTPRTAEVEASSIDQLPRQTRADFEFLMRLALKEPTVAHWIRSTVDVLQR